ncbi:GNAT family N-acetyltransferase [uncultured Roseovarius sp.]|uniref:GNAT family N-acetyltransferase n=1 Tax=uncultured Roseovarius sp. TaxID=293344 RepID=UPI002619F5A3|nr:GNAT family N-acetyltransferase [uncultured Roseovarius sp.]
MSDRTSSPFSKGRDEASDWPSRWDGILDLRQKTWCEANGIPLAYDPLQIGWVIAEKEAQCPNAVPSAPLSWKVKCDRELAFRRWKAEDVGDYIRLLGDPEVWRYMHEAWPGAMSDTLARSLIDISALDDHHDVLAVTLDGRPIGQMRLAFGLDESSRDTAELSYWLGREHWQQGLGHDLVRQATKRAFADHSWLYRLVAFVHPDNPASVRCLRRVGYHDRGHRDDGWQCFVIYRDS